MLQNKNNQKLNQIIDTLNKTWRPITGWGIAIGILFAYIVFPIVYIICSFLGCNFELPKILYDNLYSLVIGAGLLGGIRTYEKQKNLTSIH